jgi:hypothetical protein
MGSPKKPTAKDASAAAKKAQLAARRVPMFVDSIYHLMRDGRLYEIQGGVLLEELDLELTPEEIDEMTAHRALRPATQAELDAADARAIGVLGSAEDDQ